MPTPSHLAPTAPDTALIFEGGGMRGSFTSGVINALLEAEVFCGWFPALRIADLPWPGQSTPVAIFTRRESSLTPVQRWFRRLVHGAVVEPGTEI